MNDQNDGKLQIAVKLELIFSLLFERLEIDILLEVKRSEVVLFR